MNKFLVSAIACVLAICPLIGNAVIIRTLPPPVVAPTLSEWAMVTFALLIVGFGVWQQRGRQL